MRILIADHDIVNRRLLEATLLKWGYEVVVCCDGPETLSRLETGPVPEMAILDWMMRRVDCPEQYSHIRENYAPIYIILLTAKNQREDLITALQSGADDYVTKPFDQQELYSRIQVGIRTINLQRNLAAHVQELEIAMMRLRRVQQAQKLEAIGQLASGVAHEINTPIQYIGDNVRFMREGWERIQRFVPQSA